MKEYMVAKKNFVVDMSSHFRDFEGFSDKLGLKQSKKDLLEENVRFRDGIKWIRVDEFGCYLYKETYDENTALKKVSLIKQERKGTKANNKKGNDHRTLSENVFKIVYIESKEKRYGTVTKEKLNNLKTQLKYVKGEYKWFYQRVIEEQENRYWEKESEENEEGQINKE
ncbi:hypothetical protein J6590_017859 [Homalodisca vitripennis]|nr:hypothetical protein J6590_017859 [Homalodisca vitripennis]